MRAWLPNPPDGTAVCGGFDGSDSDDWTAIKLETREGFIFTPRYGPDSRPTIWSPAEWDGRIPRGQVTLAWRELAQRYRLLRVYCDPGFRDESSWSTDIEDWDDEHGPGVFVPWDTAGSRRQAPVFEALRRFESDLTEKRITHDGCPLTADHMAIARKVARKNDSYGLGKPSQAQKIDIAVTSVLTHQAASDMRKVGWPEESGLPPMVFGL